MVDIFKIRTTARQLISKDFSSFIQRPVALNVTPQDLRYVGDSVSFSSILTQEKKEKLSKEFFQGVQEYFKPPVGMFKRGMRDIKGQKPLKVSIKNHSFNDSKLAQPIQISSHCNHVQPKSETISYDFVKDYLYKDEYNQARVKDYLYLDMIEVQERYHGQGVASKILDKLITHAKRNYGGRFMLTVSTPTNCNNKVPPAIKYWKKGFRFVDETENAIMRRVLNGELPITQTPEHLPMYLLLG